MPGLAQRRGGGAQGCDLRGVRTPAADVNAGAPVLEPGYMGLRRECFTGPRQLMQPCCCHQPLRLARAVRYPVTTRLRLLLPARRSVGRGSSTAVEY